MLGHEKSRLLQRGFEARKYGASRRISMIRFAQKTLRVWCPGFDMEEIQKTDASEGFACILFFLAGDGKTK